MLKRSLLALSIMTILSGCTLDGDDGATGPAGPAGPTGGTGQTGQPGKNLPRDLSIEVVGRFNTGIYGKAAAEIVQFHKSSNSAFAINAAENRIEVISLANLPVAAVGNGITDDSLSSVPFLFPASVNVKDSNGNDVSVALGEANSIAIYGDMLAIAVAAAQKTDNGAVLFYSLNATGSGTFVKAVAAGALPDMVIFTPDGTKVLVANEGEPDTDYNADPEGSISVISITAGVPADVAQSINLTTDMHFSSDLLSASDYDTDTKRRNLLQTAGVKFAGPAGTTVAQDLEPEYITVAADSKTAWVSLQEANAIGIIDLTAMTIEVKALGMKDWGQFLMDYSNEDEVASFRKLPNVYGLYQPDSIASYQWNGATFIVSANEGDSRDWDAYSEDIRAADIIDPDELNKTFSTELQALYDATGGDDGLGRLKVTAALVDPDNDGVVEKLYAYGARSFSIWDQNVNIVYDSGDDFGRISAAILGNNFNSAHTENKGDNRSDDKGGEPEAIDVGSIEGRTYAFIAQERSGDLFVYDVTNPFQTSFVSHYINRDFDAEFELDDELADPCDSSEGMDCTEVPLAGDLGPESIKFVPASDSPNGNPLLIIGNEVSGSVTVYQVTELQ
ncbi:MAG: choice-of-anchor I family protein [Gammaproteobacteria bacterium]|nr:choice-of-anchor I family protein [Gammaproteobacteria bacterium]MBU1555756.1 choice-of-anchor I family protein [Gammaproteobacteria bacterium]MBU2069505.1 choice-of-anchor I family protein [Gammaproteobacteria bacterium]MBU2183009.1 choice-of-anchor I family protein [Gammaproteobacteria bacterium]MBU2206654.1 choice-of-anchor I family protein [Gammaproteobacteria bacterium]